MKKALLVVSFGTSVPETRERTIFALEYALARAFPERKFYRAWTSGVIRKKILKTEGLAIDSVHGALDRMIADGVDFDGACAAGDLAPIRAWLSHNIWRHGRSKDPAELIQAACGEPFSAHYFCDYLKEKFSAIYRLRA